MVHFELKQPSQAGSVTQVAPAARDIQKEIRGAVLGCELLQEKISTSALSATGMLAQASYCLERAKAGDFAPYQQLKESISVFERVRDKVEAVLLSGKDPRDALAAERAIVQHAREGYSSSFDAYCARLDKILADPGSFSAKDLKAFNADIKNYR